MTLDVRYNCDSDQLAGDLKGDARPAETAANMTALYQPTIGTSLVGAPLAEAAQPRIAVVNTERSSLDAQMLRRVAEGDRRAAQLLLDQYLGRIVTYSYRMMG